MFLSISPKSSAIRDESGRGERIRTSDHLTPSQVRYQAALRPEARDYIRANIFCRVISNFQDTEYTLQLFA